MKSKLLALIAFLGALLLDLGCGPQKSIADERKLPLAQKTQDYSMQNDKDEIVIESIEFFAWWWSDEQMKAGFASEDPPPKTTYTQFRFWQYASDTTPLHPDRFDVVCQIKNTGHQPVDLLMSGIVDFKVASHDYVLNAKSDNVIKLLDPVPWTEELRIGPEVLHNLAPVESRKVTLKDLNLRAVLDKYSGQRNDDLWPWLLRVRITVGTPDGLHLTQAEATMQILPLG